MDDDVSGGFGADLIGRVKTDNRAGPREGIDPGAEHATLLTNSLSRIFASMP